MAGRLIVVLSLMLSLFLPAGCGVKTLPIPSSRVAPTPVKDLSAVSTPAGVRVRFKIPRYGATDRQVTTVLLFYGYQQLRGKVDCPPCPPVLRMRKSFELGKATTTGGTFNYLDTEAPIGHVASYQVVLVNRGGYRSGRSNFARVPRVVQAAAPGGVTAMAGQGKVLLKWSAVTTLADGKPALGVAGYRIYRKEGKGVKLINLRPLKGYSLLDKTVKNGRVYAYRVQAVLTTTAGHAPGLLSPWVKALPKDMTPPKPASDLRVVSQPDGVYLRFTPSPSQDVKGYIILRAAGRGGAFAPVGKKLSVENVFVDKAVKAKTKYLYKVVAVDDGGNKSAPTPAVQVEFEPAN